MEIRLQKFLADAGIASRRKAEILIAKGAVSVNGRQVTEMGVKINPDIDIITCNGETVSRQQKKIYIAINKPSGYITTATKKEGKSILNLVSVSERIYPVGRLDKNSSGLTLLTNDGEFADTVMHPSHGCTKEYFVVLDGDLKESHIAKLERGYILSGQKLAPIKVLSAKNKSARLELRQGVNREIRRVLGHLGYTVLKLKRVRVGKLELGNLKEGQWKKINPHDVF